MLIIKYERIYRVNKELKSLYIFRTASQNDSAIDNQLAKALSVSVYHNGCYF